MGEGSCLTSAVSRLRDLVAMEAKNGNDSLSCDPFSVMPYDQWVLINCSGSRPPGRYKV